MLYTLAISENMRQYVRLPYIPPELLNWSRDNSKKLYTLSTKRYHVNEINIILFLNVHLIS